MATRSSKPRAAAGAQTGGDAAVQQVDGVEARAADDGVGDVFADIVEDALGASDGVLPGVRATDAGAALSEATLSEAALSQADGRVVPLGQKRQADGRVLAEGESGIDRPRVEAAIREILLAVGEDPDRDGLLATPARVARSYEEMFAGLRQDPAQVLATQFEIDHDEMVLVRDIEVYSTCEHHLVPFHGVAHIGYIPSQDGRVTGLSKLARLVDVFAKRPQVQERITTQVADALVEHLRPRGVIVVLECEHLCMSMRGVKKPGARTITSAVRGILRRPATRAEAMSLVLAGGRG